MSDALDDILAYLFRKANAKLNPDNQKRYNSLFNENTMLNDAIQMYVDNKITKDDVLLYLAWNDFSDLDIDWKLIEKARKKGTKNGKTK